MPRSRNIQIDIHGNFELLIEVGREQYITMIDDGTIEGNNYDYAFPSDDDSDGRGSDGRHGHERGSRRRMIGPTILKNNGVTLTIENRR